VYVARLFNKDTYEEATDDHPDRAPATLEKSKLDLRNTIKTGVVKRCTRVILEFFSGPGKPLEKVETGRKVVGMLKPYRASWGIDGKFRKRMDDGHIGTDPYDSQQFRKAATEAASAVLDDFEDVKMQRVLDGNKPWDLETRGGALQKDQDAARTLHGEIVARKSKYIRFKRRAAPAASE